MEPLSQFKTIRDVKHTYHLVTTAAERDALVKKLSGHYEICFDTETTSLNTLEAKLVGISFSYEKGKGYYVPIPENDNEAALVLERFKPFFDHEQIIFASPQLSDFEF